MLMLFKRFLNFDYNFFIKEIFFLNIRKYELREANN